MSESFPYADGQARQSTAPVPPDSSPGEWPSATRYARHLEAYYDAVNDAYDDWSSGIHRRLGARLIEIASPLPGERLLDVGCGTGLVTQMAADRVGPSGEVFGVDIAKRLLEVAQRRASPRVRFFHVPAEALVFSDCTFDVVTIGDALPYLSDPRRALQEAYRVLRRGSRIAVSVLDRALSTPAQEVFHERLLALELRHPVVVPRPPGDRNRFGEPEVLAHLLASAGFAGIVTTTMVTGGRAATAREWTELMMGAGPSSHALLSVLGAPVRDRFEAELTEQMRKLGEDEAFRYHHPFTFAEAIRP
ncbi:MAG: class I SAM-dependent methyltransferase [Candidatus Dormibacteria bacterium]|jgi:ubiquinone/menaquinone biosynthesis C-methylase UbiE